MSDQERNDLEERQNDLLGKLLRMAGNRPNVPDDVRARVESAVHAHWKKEVSKRSRRRIHFFLTGAIAASALIFVLIWQFSMMNTFHPIAVGFVVNLQGGVLNSSINQPVVRGGVLMSGSTIETDSTGRVFIRLTRDASIRVDVNSKLHLKSDSEYDLQNGAAYLDCKKPHSSIALNTPLGLVRDKGTQFEVRLNDTKLQIQVREGAVLFDQNGVVHTVNAGNRLIVDKGGHERFSKISPFGAEWNWISEVAPPFAAEGRPLIEFLNWITQENGWTLKFSEPIMQTAASQTILHGSINGLSSHQMLDAVLPVCGLTYSIQNGILEVKAK
jgi:FecR protein